MRKAVKATALDGYRLDLVFDDGVRGTANLAGLVGKGVFAMWNDYEAFKPFRVGPSGEVSWGDVVDLCPHSLYLRVTGKQPKDIFPELRRTSAHA
ncbi:MAG: DUF2442 domain-containing protein [bacterium]|nr:DUF2442 domain-containing protein [bacterium]